MRELYPLFGIVTVLNTPFTSDDQIDIPALKKHVEYAIKSGVAGILVPAMASEVYKLSLAERRQIVEAVLQQNNNRVTVIGGAGETKRDRRRQVVEDLFRSGCRNILLQIPFENDKQYRSDVARIADLQPEMIMLQDWDFGGGGLPIELIQRLFQEIRVFRCLKIETVPAGVKYSTVLQATQGRLHVSGGWAVAQMIEGLRRGMHAFMPTGMHEIYVRIYRLFKEDRQEEALALFNNILPVLSFSNQHLDISVHFFKRLLLRQGIYNTAKVRQPILPFDSLHEELAEKHIRYILELIESIRSTT